MSEMSDTEAAFHYGVAAADARTAQPGGTPYAVVPQGAEVVNLEKLLEKPARKRGRAGLTDTESFTRYVKDHGSADTAIFAAPAGIWGVRFEAVIDYHAKHEGGAAWCEHRAWFCPELSREWNEWMARNGTVQSQEDFATFIEAQQQDVTQPSGADLLELATDLSSTTKVDFHAAVTLQNGAVQLAYRENEESTVELPKELKLGLPLYRGGKRFEMTARLRYRVRERRVVFITEIVSPQRVADFVNNELRQDVEKGTGITVYAGAFSQ